MNPQAIQALIRRILRAAGVMLATRGVVSDEAWSLISGAILTVAMETWSFAVKVRAGDRGKDLWVTFVQNSTRAVAYVFVTRGTIASEEAELYCGLIGGLVLEWWTLNETAKRSALPELRQEQKKEGDQT